MVNSKKDNTIPEKDLFSRGVHEVIGLKKIEEKLDAGAKLRIKYGIDPTSPHIHLGRATALLKLRGFQERGHTVVFVVGDFTATIGDTSDKDAERPMLTKETVEQNLTTYVRQAGKLLDMDKVEVHHNSTWLGDLSYAEVCEQADNFSVADFIARDNIARRLKAGSRVSLRELLYPIMQGYDSVILRADVEIGGTDQRFNLLAGRTLQEHYRQPPQNIIMLDLLEGLDGRKMSSSWGNTINIEDEPSDMYGKVMSLRDKLIIPYFIRATCVSVKKIQEYERALANGENPKNIKIHLARAITSLYHGEDAGKKAEEFFTETFSQKNTPKDILVVDEKKGELLSDVVLRAGLVKSKTEWRTLVDGGAVEWMDGNKNVADSGEKVHAGVLKIGKRRFLRVRLIEN
ncbi:MAG: tyrosine--tRNA ligase [Minisyncoccota bacterium]